MKSTKMVLWGGATILSATLAFGFVSTSNDYSIDSSFAPNMLKPEMITQKNVEVGKSKLGLDVTHADGTHNKIHLNFKGDNGVGKKLTQVQGHASIEIDGVSYPITFGKASNLSKALLKNQHTLIYGSIDGTIHDKSGNSVIALAVAYDVDTKQSQITASVGDMSEGYVLLSFGTNFPQDETAEIRSLFTPNQN